MMTFYERLKIHLDNIDMSFYRLHYLAEIPSGHFSLWKKGRRKPSRTDIEKIAGVAEVGLSLNTLLAWKALEDYGFDVIREAMAIAHKGKEVIN